MCSTVASENGNPAALDGLLIKSRAARSSSSPRRIVEKMLKKGDPSTLLFA